MGYVSRSDLDNLAFLPERGYDTKAVSKCSIRSIMPPLTTAVIAGPLNCVENMEASLTTRVVGPSLQPHPWMARPTPQCVGPNATQVCFCVIPGGGYDELRADQWCMDRGWRSLGVRDDWRTVIAEELEAWDDADRDDEGRWVDRSPRMILVSTPSQGPSFELLKMLRPDRRVVEGEVQWLTPRLVRSSVGTIRLATCDGRYETYRLEWEEGLHCVVKNAYSAFRASHQWHPERGLLNPLSFQTWVSRYPRAARKRLSVAWEQLVNDNFVSGRDMNISNFLKKETSTSATDPRNISQRKDQLLCLLGPYVSAIEHSAHQSPYLVKGLNPRARDAKLQPLLDYGQIIELDHSRFDKHITAPILENVERMLLTDPFNYSHSLYYQAISKLTKVHGLSRFGTRYSMPGTRASGDAHTSIANGEINAFLIWVCLSTGTGFRAFCEGDDCVVGIDASRSAGSLPAAMESLGFSVKMVKHERLDGAMFCGRVLCDVAGEVRSMCDVMRSLAKFHTTTSDKKKEYLLCAKAMSYYFTDGHTPLVGVIARSLVRHLLPRLNKGVLRRVIRENTRALPWFMSSGDVSVDDLFRCDYSANPDDALRPMVASKIQLSVFAQRQLEKEYALFEHGFVTNVTKLHEDMDPKWNDVYLDQPLV